MKIINIDVTHARCKECKSIIEYDEGDVITKVLLVPASSFANKMELAKLEYIKCPQCGQDIHIGLRVV